MEFKDFKHSIELLLKTDFSSYSIFAYTRSGHRLLLKDGEFRDVDYDDSGIVEVWEIAKDGYNLVSVILMEEIVALTIEEGKNFTPKYETISAIMKDIFSKYAFSGLYKSDITNILYDVYGHSKIRSEIEFKFAVASEIITSCSAHDGKGNVKYLLQ